MSEVIIAGCCFYACWQLSVLVRVMKGLMIAHISSLSEEQKKTFTEGVKEVM